MYQIIWKSWFLMNFNISDVTGFPIEFGHKQLAKVRYDKGKRPWNHHPEDGFKVVVASEQCFLTWFMMRLMPFCEKHTSWFETHVRTVYEHKVLNYLSILIYKYLHIIFGVQFPSKSTIIFLILNIMFGTMVIENETVKNSEIGT